MLFSTQCPLTSHLPNAMGALYGPGLLPCTPDFYDLSDQQQIDFLCQFAALDLLPMFHEVIGGVVYRITSQDNQVKIGPISSKINDRVLQDVIRLTQAIPPELVEWIEAPLLLPDSRSRRNKVMPVSLGPTFKDWRLKDIRDGRNTLTWLYTEAQENVNAAKPKGYTAQLGMKYGFDTVIEHYRQLLDCLHYCEKFKFICRIV